MKPEARVWENLENVPDFIEVYDLGCWIHYRRMTGAHAGRYHMGGVRTRHDAHDLFGKGPYTEVIWGWDELLGDLARIRGEDHPDVHALPNGWASWREADALGIGE